MVTQICTRSCHTALDERGTGQQLVRNLMLILLQETSSISSIASRHTALVLIRRNS
jgi:hypothetical protein